MNDLFNYENLVYSIINKYGKSFDQDDLYQVGMMGLINASKNFDSSMNVKFSSYAYYYIYGEVMKYIRESKCIRVSKDIIKLNGQIEKTKDLMRQRLGRDPTDCEVSLVLEIDEEKIREVKESMIEFKSLDYNYDEDNDLYNTIGSESKEMSIESISLKGEIEKLEPIERNIIIERYYNDLTQSEVSKELGISQVQVSRKENKVLQKLRVQMET